MKRLLVPLLISLIVLAGFASAPRAHAACASVSIEILQKLTLERTAFDAKMVITNGIADQALENRGGARNSPLFFI